MLEHPPIANAQEKSESLKPDFLYTFAFTK